jgi:prepilin-type N-terminal cleavage/methylation domain-containing protein
MRSSRGFTLIELLIVVVSIAVIEPSLMPPLNTARITTDESEAILLRGRDGRHPDGPGMPDGSGARDAPAVSEAAVRRARRHAPRSGWQHRFDINELETNEKIKEDALDRILRDYAARMRAGVQPGAGNEIKAPRIKPPEQDCDATPAMAMLELVPPAGPFASLDVLRGIIQQLNVRRAVKDPSVTQQIDLILKQLS